MKLLNDPPWVVEIDGIKFATPEAVVLLLKSVSEERDELQEALEAIVNWSEAYPLDVFPEPDFEKAHQLLQTGGMTLDAISASNMRRVVEGVGKIAKEALDA